jgi:GTPase SAR1 family protein
VANLDPAAEHFGYPLAFDIRELVSVEEVMEELGLGPNGGLIYCMEYLLNNLDWLQDHLDTFGDDDYLLLDCPGQLELYTHVPLMRNVIDRMRMWGYEASMVAVFLIDTTFVCDTSKFISGSLLSLSAMIALELPHVNCGRSNKTEIPYFQQITTMERRITDDWNNDGGIDND